MLPRSARLPRSEFRARGYKTFRDPLFLLKIKSNGKEHGRIGIVVGKAVHPKATRRNFLKRQVKSVFQSMKFPNLDLLVILSPAAGAVTRKDLRAAFQKNLKSLHS